MATWIWPTAFYGAVITVTSLAAITEGDNMLIILLAALLSGLFGVLALVLKRASLLAFAAVGSFISWVWFVSVVGLGGILGTMVGLPLSLLILFGGLWLWRNQEALRSHLPRFISELHSGGPDSTLW